MNMSFKKHKRVKIGSEATMYLRGKSLSYKARIEKIKNKTNFLFKIPKENWQNAPFNQKQLY